MAKKRLLKEQEEMFVLNAEKVEVTKTVHVEIQDFTKKIDDEENKKKRIISPKFKVGDTSFTVRVYPQQHWKENFGESIAVCIDNEEKENVIATVTFKHASGAKRTFKNKEMTANGGWGFFNFLSHETYKNWAKDHGDVFKLEVEITLHVKKPAQWTSNR